MSRIYCDSQIIIYTVEHHPVYEPLLIPLWEGADSGRFELFTSELTILESLVVPLRLKNQKLIETYSSVFGGSRLKVIPITQPVLTLAAQLRADNAKLKTPDAIHVATAIGQNCEFFFTHDTNIPQVPDIKIMGLSGDDIAKQF